MLRVIDPTEAYRRIEFDACVAGSDAGELVLLCIAHVRAALSQAIWADRQGRSELRVRSLGQARSGLVALRMGVDRTNPLADDLLTLYGAMEDAVTAAQFRFNRPAIDRLTADLDEIAAVCRESEAA